MSIRNAHYNMVEQQIRPWDVHHPALLERLHTLPRADFMPTELKQFAYMDTELPLILNGQDTGTRLMPPRLAARIVQELELKGTESVALIGAGDGYLAALIASFAHQLTVIECDETIAQFAQANLNRAHIPVQFELKNGLTASTDRYDVVVLAGSIGRLNQTLLKQIVIGGQLFAVIGKPTDAIMSATLITRTDEQAWSQKHLFETTLPALTLPQNTPTTPNRTAFVF